MQIPNPSVTEMRQMIAELSPEAQEEINLLIKRMIERLVSFPGNHSGRAHGFSVGSAQELLGALITHGILPRRKMR